MISTSEANTTVDADEELQYICPCGKGYRKKSKTWYARHITLCSKYIFMNTNNAGIEPPLNYELIRLDKLAELESIEDIGDFMYDVDSQVGINMEKKKADEEKEFDRDFVFRILVDDSDE